MRAFVNGRALFSLVAVVAAIAAAGCGDAGTGGLSTGGDVAKGKELFIKGECAEGQESDCKQRKQSCGSCHTLADAETTGAVGPNLDDAFRAVRDQGFDESSIQQVVAGQIRDPITQTSTGSPGMPADLVTGDSVDDVARYLASVAGTTEEGAKPGGGGAASGEDIFTSRCGGCHTLATAGTSGSVGPNLDDSKPPKALVVDRVTNGKGGMPSFEGQLTSEQIDAVSDYVATAAGS